MPQYAFLIYSDETVERTPDEGAAVMKAYMAYGDVLDAADAKASGEALHPTSTATCVRVRDGERLTTDGPFVESKEALGGFYLVHAPDLDAAIELAAACPGAQHGTVEVRPVIDFGAE